MGPSETNEIIADFPTSRYIVGRLAPATVNNETSDSALDSTADDSLGVGTDTEEDGEDEPSLPLVGGLRPSSLGLSFLVAPDAPSLRVNVAWADYIRVDSSNGATNTWRRDPRQCVIDGLSTTPTSARRRVPLSPSMASGGLTVSGDHDPDLTIESVVTEISGQRAVSLFLVNRRTQGELGDRDKDARWIYQPKLTISSSDGRPVFLARGIDHEHAAPDDDGDASITALLYRDIFDFASGHGVSANWISSVEHQSRAASVFTEFIPSHHTPLLGPSPEARSSGALDMKALAEAPDPNSLVADLTPLVTAYERWIVATRKASLAPDIQGSPHLRDAANNTLSQCAASATRIREALALLRADNHVYRAFLFANAAMWDQRIHSIWAAANQAAGQVTGSPRDYDLPENRTWRPFQISFFLLNLVGVACEESEDRRTVDLLWFPTGGGKTEAYLGLAAFTLALRRLRGDRHGMAGGAGVSIIMRYTLRLLTVQQFQRAAALICACELIRQGAPDTWGTEPFRIGIWVGRGTTPNTFQESKDALEALNNHKTPKEGSPVQVVTCPRCGSTLVNQKGEPLPDTYVVDNMRLRTLVWCPYGRCSFSAQSSSRAGLPVVCVDDEIYRACPSLLVATVDKFARLPFKGETRTLFGLRNRYSPRYGHLSAAHGVKVGGRKVTDSVSAVRLLPPELVVQDELHLISGPLGTMVGLYESAVDFASQLQVDREHVVPSKVIASTATIRRAEQQVRQLYARPLRVFPAPGIIASDSFFAQAPSSPSAAPIAASRRYVGIMAPGTSTKTLLVRVYSALLAFAAEEIRTNAKLGDPYGTLVGYFNSLRALGGAKRLVEDDIPSRLRYLSTQFGLVHRRITEPRELTSRLDSWHIPGLLKKLGNRFPRGSADWPIDVLLATNMISVGVDIDRLGLMVVTGQPKTTAEYIQATSRVGRQHPGLIVTMYNWLGARDLSHYERFHAYHSALYRHVEAISVTPFSSRALDRGLPGVFAAMNRITADSLALESDASNFDPRHPHSRRVLDALTDRALHLTGLQNAQLVRARLESHRDRWALLASSPLRYTWLNEDRKPPDNSRVLIRTSGTGNEGVWAAPGSLREVESAAAFYLDEEGHRR